MKKHNQAFGISLLLIASAIGFFYGYSIRENLQGFSYALFGVAYGVSLYISGIFAEKAFQHKQIEPENRIKDDSTTGDSE